MDPSTDPISSHVGTEVDPDPMLPLDASASLHIVKDRLGSASRIVEDQSFI